MNKSAFLNHGLMKRRYSVPETVMRKHKLQGSLLKVRSAEVTTLGTHNPPKESNHCRAQHNKMIMHDESCQTDECIDYMNHFKLKNSLRKSLKCRRRDSLRYFKKSNSYCQYRSLSMLHKRMLNKHKEPHLLSLEQTNVAEEFLDENIAGQSKSQLVFDKFLKDASREIDADNYMLTDGTKSLCKTNSLQKSNSNKRVLSVKELSPIMRQQLYPPFNSKVDGDALVKLRGCNCDAEHLNRVSADKSEPSLLAKPMIVIAEDKNFKTKEIEEFAQRKILVDFGKSLDQNTSGYNTVNGSLDTPCQKTPDTPKLPQMIAGAAEDSKHENSHSTHQGHQKKPPDPAFPITFHSESIYMHPYENGFLSHKELHHISIQVVPANSTPCNSSCWATSTTNDSEIKAPLNENDDNLSQEKTECVSKNAKGLSSIDSDPKEHSPKGSYQRSMPRDVVQGAKSMEELTQHEESCKGNTDLYQMGSAADYIKNGSANHNDCYVPTQGYPLSTIGGKQPKLKIEVDATDVNLSNGLHNMLLGQSAKHITNEHEYPLNQAKEMDTSHLRYKYPTNDKYNSKAALNYLFQKLGDAYPPKRCLLKQPLFQDSNSQYAQYYSDLPKIERFEIPQTVLFNNQTYDILSGSLLPGEWSNARGSIKYENNTPSGWDPAVMKKTSTDEHLSDSDISIPDSLEDFQDIRTTKCNKYEKYDKKLARGDICSNVKPSIMKPKRCGQSISYFINLGESKALKRNTMPATLRERLGKRSRSILKHSPCFEVHRKLPRSAKLIHKQIQTCLNADNSLRKCRKRVANGANRTNEELMPTNTKNECRVKDADLDERIMNILLSSLHVKDNDTEKVEAQTPQYQSTASQSVQTESPDQSFESPTVSKYVEVFRMSSPVDSTNGGIPNGFGNEEMDSAPFFPKEPSVSAENNLYEVTMSEEIGKINSTNYYRSIKKSRRIYYPTKMAEKRFSFGRNGGTREQMSPGSTENQTVPLFSKYQRKLKEFKQQMRRQNNDKIKANYFTSASLDDSSSLHFNENFGNESSGFLELQYTRMRDKNKSKNLAGKIPGPRSHRFYQRFEAIPEELSNSLETADQIQNKMDIPNEEGESVTIRSDESIVIDAYNDEETDKVECDINQNEAAIARTEIALHENYTVEKLPDNNKDHNQRDTQNNYNLHSDQKQEKTDEYKDKLKSQKGRDSLSVVREQEELITLSRGWINFYLLNGNNTEDNIGEEIEEENVALSETFRIPQQYMVHVQATPENSNEQTPNSSTTLPGLCKYSKNRLYNPCKVKHLDKTILPDIGNAFSACPKAITNGSTRNRSLRNSLPKLHLSGDESDDVCSRKSEDANSQIESTTEPVSTPHGVVQAEKSSSVILSSNYSQHSSSMEDVSERNEGNFKKIQRYQRPHTYHSPRNNNKRWMLTIEGSHNTCEKGASSDVEMQLSVKNNQVEGPSNHSWKFTMKNEDVCLPHLNVNYKMLPFAIYQDENRNTSYSENNSRSNSALSFGEKKNAGKNYSSSLSHPTKRINGGDTKLQIGRQIRRSADDLTIRGSAITPERKPRIPTMSERDLTRMRLIKLTNMEHHQI